MTIPKVETSFLSYLSGVATDVETLLDRLLAQGRAEGEIARPDRLLQAMRYASLGGGKRFRPFLVAATAALFGVPRERALMAAAALECIHCYSLVHDDLPAMDNDDMRRGRPTAHKTFDDATAILAGDSLLTFAFDILARPETHPDPAVRIELVGALARASGIGGMAGGSAEAPWRRPRGAPSGGPGAGGPAGAGAVVLGGTGGPTAASPAASRSNSPKAKLPHCRP